MMLNVDFARIRAHRNNIHRYRRLLETKLSDQERRFVERRLSEERASMEALTAQTSPVAFSFAKDRVAPAGSEATP